MNRSVLLVAALIAAGCSKGGFSQRTGNQAGILRYALGDNPTTLDPARVQDVDTMDLLGNVYEGLVRYDANNRIEPCLAESWEIKDGGRTYVFKLRKVVFHNGAPLVANDVKRSFERALAPSLASPTAANYLSDILGASDVVAGRAKELTGVKALALDLVSITLDQPRAYFLGKLTYPCAFILPGVHGAKPVDMASPGLGTGPFRFTTWAPQQSYELSAFDRYWGGSPKIGGIYRPVVKDSATRLNKFWSGELHYVALERQDVPAAKARAEVRYMTRPAVNYLLLNPKAYPPFADRRVRRAIAMAIDRERICEDVLGGVPHAYGLLPPGIQGHRPSPPTALRYDPAAAKRELAAFGRPLPPLALAVRAQRPDAGRMAEAIAADLTRNLGVPTKVRAIEWGALLEARNKRQLPFVVSSWYGDYVDPQNFLSFLLMTGSPQNYEGWSNPRFDALCRQADAEPQEAIRAKLYQQAEDIALSEAVRIPISFVQDAYLVSPRVSGLRTNLLGLMPHTETTER